MQKKSILVVSGFVVVMGLIAVFVIGSSRLRTPSNAESCGFWEKIQRSFIWGSENCSYASGTDELVSSAVDKNSDSLSVPDKYATDTSQAAEKAADFLAFVEEQQLHCGRLCQNNRLLPCDSNFVRE